MLGLNSLIIHLLQSGHKAGDKVSSDFFKIVKENKSCNGMKQLQRDDGSIIEDVGEMRDIATQFYSNLLFAQCFTINQLVTRQCVWQTMHAQVYCIWQLF